MTFSSAEISDDALLLQRAIVGIDERSTSLKTKFSILGSAKIEEPNHSEFPLGLAKNTSTITEKLELVGSALTTTQLVRREEFPSGVATEEYVTTVITRAAPIYSPGSAYGNLTYVYSSINWYHTSDVLGRGYIHFTSSTGRFVGQSGYPVAVLEVHNSINVGIGGGNSGSYGQNYPSPNSGSTYQVPWCTGNSEYHTTYNIHAVGRATCFFNSGSAVSAYAEFRYPVDP